MVEASAVAPNAERLTWDAVCRRYPDEWVVLADTEWVNDTDFELRATTVIGHGKGRAEALAQARPLLERCDRFGFFFTGRARALPRIYVEP